MRTLIAAAVLVVGLAAYPAAPAQDTTTAPANLAPAVETTYEVPPPPQTPRERDELQARIFMATKRFSEAAKLYEKLAKENPKVASYYNYAGLAYMQQGDLRAAKKQFERATKVDKYFATAFNNLGALHYALKNYKQAVRQYQKALQIQPDTAGYYANLGYAYFGQKKHTQALEAFQRALTLDPTVFGQGDRTGSIMQFRSVTDPGLYNYMLAKAYGEVSDVERCATHLRKAFDEGYKDIKKALTDKAFDKVRHEPAVAAVFDLIAPPLPTQAASN